MPPAFMLHLSGNRPDDLAATCAVARLGIVELFNTLLSKVSEQGMFCPALTTKTRFVEPWPLWIDDGERILIRPSARYSNEMHFIRHYEHAMVDVC